MRKLLNKPWFVALLAVAAVGFVAHSLMSQSGRDGAVASPEVFEEVAPETDPLVSESSGQRAIPDALRELVLQAVSRDPFAPRAKPEAAPQVSEKPAEPDSLETVKLSALWTQGGETYLLINDRIMTAGESIGRLTLDAVTADGVWLTHWKGRDFLSIGASFTLVTPAKQTAAQAAFTPAGDS